MHSKCFKRVYKLYKTVLTIPSTQVSCERSFSKLKIIKNKLRSTISDENLENNMILNCEFDIMNNISNELVIDELSKTSKEMSRLLM